MLIAAACGPLPMRAAAPTAAPTPTPRDLASAVFAPVEDPAHTPVRSPASTPLVPTSPASIGRGAWLFTLRACYTCHGEAAEGLVGPRLAGTLLPFDAVITQVRAPRTGRMPPFPQDRLPDEGVADIYNFVRSLGAP